MSISKLQKCTKVVDNTLLMPLFVRSSNNLNVPFVKTAINASSRWVKVNGLHCHRF